MAAGDLDGDGVPEIVGGTGAGGLKVFALEKGRVEAGGYAYASRNRTREDL